MYSEALAEVKGILMDEVANARAKKNGESDDDGSTKKRKRRGFRRPGGRLNINIHCEEVKIEKVVIIQRDE